MYKSDNKIQPANETTKERVLPLAFFVIMVDKSKASWGVMEGSFIIKIGAAKYLNNKIKDINIPKIVRALPSAQTEDAQYGIAVLSIS